MEKAFRYSLVERPVSFLYARDKLLHHDTFATGGYGPAECLFPDEEELLGDSLKAGWDQDKCHMQYQDFGDSIRHRDDMWGSCEVSCYSWAVFKICNYLLRFPERQNMVTGRKKCCVFENYRYSAGPVAEKGNIYPREYARLFYEGQKESGQEEIVNLIRCAWAGSQRYGALVWSGDIMSTYEDFRKQVCAGIHRRSL